MNSTPTHQVERCAAAYPDESIHATSCIVFYGDTHATKHSIDHTGEVSPGTWVSQSDIASIRESFDRLKAGRKKQEAEFDGMLPYHVLCSTPSRLIWRVPGATRHIVFSAPDMEALSGYRDVPSLVFEARKAGKRSVDLWVYCEVTGSEHLHVAPFPNIMHGSQLCIGSMPSYGTQLRDAELWTEAFFGSTFTHSEFKNYWTAVANGKKPDAPKSMGLTLKQLIETPV